MGITFFSQFDVGVRLKASLCELMIKFGGLNDKVSKSKLLGKSKLSYEWLSNFLLKVL